jgi:hypothetical protein
MSRLHPASPAPAITIQRPARTTLESSSEPPGVVPGSETPHLDGS